MNRTFIVNQSESILFATQSRTVTHGHLVFLFITCWIGLSFFLIRSQWGYSAIDFSSTIPSEVDGIISIANLKPAAGKALLGFIGTGLLILPSHTSREYRMIPLVFIFGYLVLCFSSIVWSANTELTIRRLLILLLYFVGILGAVRHLSTRQLLDSVIVVASILIFLGLVSELIYGTFYPLQSNYRFAGTMHPNYTGSTCALLTIAAYCGLRHIGSNKLLYLTALAIGIVFLFLSKSRTNILGCFMAVYLTSFFATSFRAKQLLLLIPLIFICIIMLTISFAAPGVLTELDLLINLGRDLDRSDIASFNGRVPLWIFLKDYILQRPLLGYGYHGFWTPNTIESFSGYIMIWGAASGHSVIIDVLLQVGIVGALFFGLSFISVFLWVVKDCNTFGRPEEFFVFAIAVYAFVFGLMESQLLGTRSFVAFAISVALFNSCIIKDKITKNKSD